MGGMIVKQLLQCLFVQHLELLKNLKPGSYPSRFDELLEILKHKMQQYRSQRATRSEFEAVKQWKNEDLRDYSRRVRQLADIAFPEKTLRERERDMRDQFIEGLFDSRIQLNLYEDERDRDIGEILQRSQELEIVHKTHESKRERKLDKLRYSQHNESKDPDLIRAGYFLSNNQFEKEFAALQTFLTNVANRFDRFENSICQQISKQADSIVKQTWFLVQGMKDMSSAIVGALGSLQRLVGGQPQSWQAPRFQALFYPSFCAPLTRTGSSGQLNISHPLHEEAECFNCKAIGHYAIQCPSLSQSNSLNYRQPSMQ